MVETKQNARSEKYHQVSFLPWADLHEEIKIGPIVFLPFRSEAQKRIQNKEILNHLEEYFRCYVSHEGKSVDTIVICAYEDVNFQCLTDNQYDDLRHTVDVLIFCIIAPQTKNAVTANNRSMGPPSAERLQLITQNFIPGNKHIAVRAGSCLHGGWEIGQITFPKPWSVGGAFGSPDKSLIEGFNKVFLSEFPNDVRERLFRCLEWFRLAHVDNDDISPLSKVIMMSTAFEIFLQVPNTPNKKRWIADAIDKRISIDDCIRETRKDSKGNDQVYSMAAWWIWDFYELRNCIVHGDHIEFEKLRYHTPEKDWLTHLMVADLVLWECIQKELFDQKCIGDNVRACAKEWDKAFPNEPQGTSEELLVGLFLGFNDIYRSLGWLKTKASDESISKASN